MENYPQLHTPIEDELEVLSDNVMGIGFEESADEEENESEDDHAVVVPRSNAGQTLSGVKFP